METESAFLGAVAALLLVVLLVQLRREPLARRFAWLSAAYGLWCIGLGAAGAGAPWGTLIGDSALACITPLALATSAALCRREPQLARYAPLLAGIPALLITVTLALRYPPFAVRAAVHGLAFAGVVASAVVLSRFAPPPEQAVSLDDRRLRYLVVAHWIVASGALLDVLAWQLGAPRVAVLLTAPLYLYAGYLYAAQVRLADLRQLVGNTVALSLMALVLAGFFAAVRLWVGERLDLFVFNAFLASLALLFFFAPLRGRIQGTIERRLVAGKVALEQGMRQLRERLSRALTLDELVAEVIAELERTELFRSSSIFLVDDATLGFQLAASFGLPTRVRVSLLGDPLWAEALEQADVLQSEELERLAADPKYALERPRIDALRDSLGDLDAELVLPLRAPGRLMGFWTLADARSQESFSSEEVRLLRAVGNQIATSIEHSKTFENLRVRDRFVSLGEMAAGLAHEIRNPLAAIRGAVAVLPEPPDGKSAELHQVIVEEIARLNRVVESFLDYARPATRHAPLRDVGAFVKSCTEAVARAKRRADVELAIEVEPDLPSLHADADQLERVLVNVVQNAYEALEGPGTVRVVARRVPPSSGQDAWLEIAILDDGPGMSDATLERAFVPFYTTKERGTGLGLALCERLIRAQNGTIQIRSRPGEGTTVVLRLPYRPPEEAA